MQERPAFQSSQVTSMIRGGGLDIEVVPRVIARPRR
jgi:hypothetical protein